MTMAKGGLDTSCASGITQLDLVSPNRFAVLEDPEQEEAKMPDLGTAEPEEIAQDECLGNKAEEGVVKEITPEESDLAHRSEDLEERVDTGSTMAVTEGDLFCDKQMTSNKNLRAANPKKRGEPEKSSKSKRSGTGAMTLNKGGRSPLVRITLNEEWANKIQNISEMLNSKKEGGGGKSRPKNKRKIRAAQDEKPEAALRCEGLFTRIVPHEGPHIYGMSERSVKSRSRERPKIF